MRKDIPTTEALINVTAQHLGTDAAKRLATLITETTAELTPRQCLNLSKALASAGEVLATTVQKRSEHRLCPNCLTKNINKSSHDWHCLQWTGGCGKTYKLCDPQFAGLDDLVWAEPQSRKREAEPTPRSEAGK